MKFHALMTWTECGVTYLLAFICNDPLWRSYYNYSITITFCCDNST